MIANNSTKIDKNPLINQTTSNIKFIPSFQPKIKSDQNNDSNLRGAFLTANKSPEIVQDDTFIKVYDLYDQLSGLINNLDDKIDDMLNKSQSEFVQSYRTYMFKIQQEIKELRRKTDEAEIRIRQNEQIINLEKSSKLFREESFKLTETLNKKNKEIMMLKNKIQLLEEEKEFLTGYLKTMAQRNKDNKPPQEEVTSNKFNAQIKLPFDSSTQRGVGRSLSAMRQRKNEKEGDGIFMLSKLNDEYLPDFESGLPKLNEFLNELKGRDFDDKLGIILDIQTFTKKFSNDYERKLVLMKKDIDREVKEKNKILSQRTTDFVVRSDLESIFIDCIEQVRREVFKRKTNQKRYYDKMPLLENTDGQAATAKTIEFKQFLNSDKQKILELFLTQEHILIALYDKLFPKTQSATGKMGSLNSSIIGGPQNTNHNINNTLDITILDYQNNIIDLIAKDENINNGGNLASINANKTMDISKDNISIPDILIKQRKRLPEHLLQKKKTDELSGLSHAENQKRINDILSDSALYSDVKYSTRNIMNSSLLGNNDIKKNDLKSSGGWKLFKV